MSPHDEISSTEKLLDVIRSHDTMPGKTPAVPTLSPTTRSPKSRLAKILPFQEPITVGVDIGHTSLRLVKITQPSDQKWKLLDYRCVPFEPCAPKGTPEFADFLKSALAEFCGPSKRLNIWSIISPAQVDVRHLRIPRVAKKQVANAVYWTVKKEAPFDEEETIFDFEVQGDVIEKGVRKIAVVAYTAPKREVEETKDLFSKSGFTLTGITIGPFALQNLFRTGWVPTFDQTVASLHIGHDWSRIDIFSRGSLVLTRGIKTGVNSMIESLMQGVGESMDMEQARKVIFSLNPASPPLAEEDAGFQLKEQEIFDMVRPAVDRLVRQVERTFEHYTVTLGNESVGKVYISGTINTYTPLVDYIGDQLGVDTNVFDPLDPAGIPFLGAVPPESVTERAPFALALGLALSDNTRTPNLIFTCKDKEKQASITRINRGIFVAFMFAVVFCLGIFWWLENSVDQKKATIAQLQQQVAQYSPCVDQTLILQMAAKAQKSQQSLKENSKKYQAMAVVGELSTLTLSNIRLLSITADLGSLPEDKSKSAEKSLVVDGIILGDYRRLEASLARYMMRLESSPIFSSPVIQKSSLESYDEEGEVLHFTLKLKLV